MPHVSFLVPGVFVWSEGISSFVLRAAQEEARGHHLLRRHGSRTGPTSSFQETSRRCLEGHPGHGLPTCGGGRAPARCRRGSADWSTVLLAGTEGHVCSTRDTTLLCQRCGATSGPVCRCRRTVRLGARGQGAAPPAFAALRWLPVRPRPIFPSRGLFRLEPKWPKSAMLP